MRKGGIDSDSRFAVAHLGLIAASRFQLLLKHRFGVRSPASCTQVHDSSAVRKGGIEPPASVLSGQRSTTELLAHIFYFATAHSCHSYIDYSTKYYFLASLETIRRLLYHGRPADDVATGLLVFWVDGVGVGSGVVLFCSVFKIPNFCKPSMLKVGIFFILLLSPNAESTDVPRKEMDAKKK